MTPVLASIVVALLAAAGVLLLAARLTGTPSARTFVGDLRAGLHGDSGKPGLLAAARREHTEAAEADGDGLVDLFRAAASTGPAYLRADDIAGRLGGRRTR